MQLTAFPDNSPQPLGYVESRKKGRRIIIVIDDYFDLPNWHKIEPPPDTAGGLKKLYNIAGDWGLTRGIGFFALPNPNNIQVDIDKIINAIDVWLNDVCANVLVKSDDSKSSKFSIREEFNYYILIDAYFGENNPVGNEFVSRWLEREIIPDKKQKIAYLSTIGMAFGWKNLHNLEIFSKVEIDVSPGLPEKLKDWLGFQPSSLETIWENSIGWFDDNKSDVVKHDFSKIEQFFLSESQRADAYLRTIENSLNMEFPESWKNDLESLKNIHESLKHLCGEVFSGTTNEDGCRNISVGAAYLVALKAHNDLFGHFGALGCDPDFWKGCPRVTAAIFPLQDTSQSRASSVALYGFFYRVFEATEAMSVKTAYFDQGGEVLRIQLNWNAKEKSSNRTRTLVQRLSSRFESEQVLVPDPDKPGNIANSTRDAVARLWRSMMLNQDGCMSPGVVYIEEDEIFIASTEYLIWGDRT